MEISCNIFKHPCNMVLSIKIESLSVCVKGEYGIIYLQVWPLPRMNTLQSKSNFTQAKMTFRNAIKATLCSLTPRTDNNIDI